MTKYFLALSCFVLALTGCNKNSGGDNNNQNPVVTSLSPAVGDEVEYSLTTHNLDGTIDNGTLIYRLSDFDTGTSNFTFEMINNGQSTQTEMSKASISENFYNKDVLSNCEKYVGGKVEQVEVPAGTFQSCAYTYEAQGKAQLGWTGLVPFALIKMRITWPDGTYMDQQLVRITKK